MVHGFSQNGQNLLVSFGEHGPTPGFIGRYTKQGTQWKASQLSPVQGSRLAALPSTPNTIIATFGSGSLHQSIDGGHQWRSVFQDDNHYMPRSLQADRNGTLLWSSYIGAPDIVTLRWFNTEDLQITTHQGGG